MTGELSKIFHGVGIGPLSKILAVKTLYFAVNKDLLSLQGIFLCFIRIHKVKSSKYEWSLDFMTIKYDS